MADSKFKMVQVGDLTPTLSMSIPRRRAFAVALRIILEALRAYWHRSPSITFWIGED